MNCHLPWGVGSPRELWDHSLFSRFRLKAHDTPENPSASPFQLQPSFPYCLFLYCSSRYPRPWTWLLLTWPQHHVAAACKWTLGRDADMRAIRKELDFLACSCTGLSLVHFDHHCCCNSTTGWKSWQIYVNLKCHFYSQIYRAPSTDTSSYEKW